MPINLTDRFALDAAPRKTSDGFIVAHAKVARTGIQHYRGDEVDPDNEHGLRDRESVAVYRPPESVFDKDSLVTFNNRPITDGHPSDPVNAETWADHAIGHMSDNTARDGDFVRAGVVIMADRAIKAIDGGKRELSVGYSTELDFTPGKTADGLQYDAKQTHIRVNHLALVGLARGGHELRIGDENAMAKRKIQIDGFTFELEDEAVTIVEKLRGERDQAVTDAKAKDTKIGELTGAVAAKDAEIATLKTDAEKNKITPQMIDERVKAIATVTADAKRIMGADFKIDAAISADADAIRKAVVDAKLKDAAKGFSTDAINGAFASLLASAPKDGATKTENDAGAGTVRDAITEQEITDARTARDKAWAAAQADELDAWKDPADRKKVAA